MFYLEKAPQKTVSYSVLGGVIPCPLSRFQEDTFPLINTFSFQIHFSRFD